MEASERLEWLSNLTASDEAVPPCAYEVAIQLAKHANRETGLAYPGLGSRVGKNSARRGAKWLRDHGWIVPVSQANGRQITYRLASPVNRVQDCTGFNADTTPVSGLTPPPSQPCTPPGIRGDALTGKEPGENRERTSGTSEPGLFDPDPTPAPVQPLRAPHMAACDAKFTSGDLLGKLKLIGARMTKANGNLDEWQTLIDKYGWKGVSDAAGQVGPADRWPNRVEQRLWDKENTCPYPPGSYQSMDWYMLKGIMPK